MALRLDQKTRLLTALPIFRAMEPEAVHVLAFSARERALAAGEVLFAAGEPSDGGFVLIDGNVMLRAGSLERPVEPGALIGETALVSETTHPATATATEASHLLVLPRALVLQVLEAHPGSAAGLRRHVAHAIAETREALHRLSF